MLSVVIPFRDERDNVEPLIGSLQGVLQGEDFEILGVDDGSVDGTSDVLQSVASRFPPLRILRHDRSLGQSAAIVSGVLAAEGDWVATLDGDGQNDPADLPALFAARDAARPEPALVMGWRRSRRDPLLKRLSSKVANFAYRVILGDDTPDVGCGIKLFRRDVFLTLPRFDHMHRFLPALVRMQGEPVISVEVHHRERRSGRSKYGIRDRLWVGIVDLFGVFWLQRRVLHARPQDRPQGLARRSSMEPGGTPSSIHAYRSR